MNTITILMIFIPIIMSFISYLVCKENVKLRLYLTLTTIFIVTALSFVTFNHDLTIKIDNLFYYGINMSLDGFRSVLISLSSIIFFIVAIISKEYFSNRTDTNAFYASYLFTLGSTIGFFLSNDLLTMFIFFEMMSFASIILVGNSKEEKAIKATKLYLGVSVVTAMITLIGMLVLYNEFQSFDFTVLASGVSLNPSKYYFVGILLSFAYLAKASIFPLHFWLPDTYKYSETTGTTVLSAVLSKTGIFGIMIILSKIFVHDIGLSLTFIILGLITAVFGGVLAAMSANIKQIYSYSSMSQLGFIVIGVGFLNILGSHNAIASAGVILYIINHSIFKTIFFSICSMLQSDKQSFNLNNLKGYGRNKPILNVVFIVAALGLMAIPLFSGYVSKTLVHESIAQYIHILGDENLPQTLYYIIEYIFLFAGGLTIAYNLKVYYALFIEEKCKDCNEIDPISHHDIYSNKLTKYTLLLVSLLIIIFGLIPNYTMELIASFGESFTGSHGLLHQVNYFSFENLQGSIITIIIGIAIFLVLVNGLCVRSNDKKNVYLDLWPKKLNFIDLFVNPIILGLLPTIGAVFSRLLDYLTDTLIMLFKGIFLRNPDPYVAPTDEYFASYDKKVAPKNINEKDSLSRSLLFIGVGILAAIILMLL